jgi:hypothetical protein
METSVVATLAISIYIAVMYTFDFAKHVQFVQTV